MNSKNDLLPELYPSECQEITFKLSALNKEGKWDFFTTLENCEEVAIEAEIFQKDGLHRTSILRGPPARKLLTLLSDKIRNLIVS